MALSMLAKVLIPITAAAALLGETPEDGAAWLHEAESHLYAWPKPGAVVQFQVKTDVVENTVAILKKQLPPEPDAETLRAIDAIRRIKIRGSVDTQTGKATADVDIPLETEDPTRKAGIDRMRSGIVTMVTKSFEGLPFHDTRLLDEGRSVLEASSQANAMIVKVDGQGGETTIRIERRRMLPESFQNSEMSMKVSYVEVVPGKFAPSQYQVELRDGSKTSASFTYQRVGKLVFPATVRVELGAIKAKMEFQSVHLAPGGS